MKGKRRGLYGGSIFYLLPFTKKLDIWKGIVAVTLNIGIILQNFRKNCILLQKSGGVQIKCWQTGACPLRNLPLMGLWETCTLFF